MIVSPLASMYIQQLNIKYFKTA